MRVVRGFDDPPKRRHLRRPETKRLQRLDRPDKPQWPLRTRKRTASRYPDKYYETHPWRRYVHVVDKEYLRDPN